YAGQDGAVRPGHERTPQPYERRLGVRAGKPRRRGAGRQSLRPRQDLFLTPNGRQLLQGDVFRLVEGQSAAVVDSELGRTAAPPARQFRRFFSLRIKAEMARGPRNRTLDALLHRLRRRSAKAVFWLLPQGREEWLEQAATGPAQYPPSRRKVRHTASE